MSLLDFALGPALKISISILLFFLAYRLMAMLMQTWQHNHAPSRGWWVKGALFTVFRRFWPMPGFRQSTRLGLWLGYLSHLGLAIVVFGGVFHIEFIEGLVGLGWPSLPPFFIAIAAIISLAAFIGLLVRRLWSPVLRSLSDLDDYISWVLTVLPLVTGLMLGYGIYPGMHYETMLAIHVLSFESLLIWIPFGKLIHSFSFVPSRAVTGAVYGQRGNNV